MNQIAEASDSITNYICATSWVALAASNLSENEHLKRENNVAIAACELISDLGASRVGASPHRVTFTSPSPTSFSVEGSTTEDTTDDTGAESNVLGWRQSTHGPSQVQSTGSQTASEVSDDALIASLKRFCEEHGI